MGSASTLTYTTASHCLAVHLASSDESMISDSTMGSSIHDISTVPQLGDWGLGTIDTFDDIDINMENMEMINDSNDDPFGDFTLEQSFNLIELNNLQDVFQEGNNIDISGDSSDP